MNASLKVMQDRTRFPGSCSSQIRTSVSRVSDSSLRNSHRGLLRCTFPNILSFAASLSSVSSHEVKETLNCHPYLPEGQFFELAAARPVQLVRRVRNNMANIWISFTILLLSLWLRNYVNFELALDMKGSICTWFRSLYYFCHFF